MDDTSFDLSKELERAIYIIIRRHKCGTASDVELQILPELIRIRAGYLIYSNDKTKGTNNGHNRQRAQIDPFELALKGD